MQRWIARPGQHVSRAAASPGFPSMIARVGRAQMAGHQIGDDLAPARRALLARQSQIEDDALPIRADPQRHKHRHPRAATADADFGKPPVEKDAADILVGEVPTAPRVEVLAQPAD